MIPTKLQRALEEYLEENGSYSWRPEHPARSTKDGHSFVDLVVETPKGNHLVIECKRKKGELAEG